MTVTMVDIEKVPSHPTAMTAILQPTPPFNFRQSLDTLKVSGAMDYLDTLADDMSGCERPVLLHDQPFLLRLTDLTTEAREPRLAMSLQADDNVQHPPTQAMLEQAAEWVNRRFFLDINMESVRAALNVNGYGADLCAKFWPTRPANLSEPWDGLLKTVISTRIFPGLAKRLQDALIQSYGPAAHFDEREYHFFPLVERLATVSPDELIAAKFSRQKADYLPGIAQMMLEEPETFNFERLRSLPGEEAVAVLDTLPGVGPWIARYVAMRGLAHPDVFIDEEGIRKELVAGMELRSIKSTKELLALTQEYAPYRTFACYYTYMRMYA